LSGGSGVGTAPPDTTGAAGQAAASDMRPTSGRDIEEELLVLLWLYKNKFRQLRLSISRSFLTENIVLEFVVYWLFVEDIFAQKLYCVHD
jgi:hypothetical protein